MSIFDEIISGGHKRMQKRVTGRSEDKKRAQRGREQEFDFNDPMFHSTRADIYEFDPDMVDVGTHMGTLDQATNRLIHTADRQPELLGKYGMDANIMPLVHATNNPFQMRDVGEWKNSTVVLDELSRMTDQPFSNQRIDRMLNEADEDRALYSDIDGWLESPENREMLDEINLSLQEQGFDSIIYRNDIESSRGFKEPVNDRLREINAEIRAIDDQAISQVPNDPMPDPADYIDTPASQQAMAMHVDRWLKRRNDAPPPALPIELQYKREALQNEAGDIRSNPEAKHNQMSRIVLDPEKIRSPEADFMPEGQQDMSKPQLLRSAAAPTAGAGLLGGAMLMSPEEAMASVDQTGPLLRGAGGLLESLGRDIAGGVSGVVERLTGGSGEEIGQARQDWEGNTIQQDPELMAGLKTLGEPIGRGLMSAFDYIGEKSEPLGRAIMDYDSPILDGGTVGDRLTEAGGQLSEFWNQLTPEDQQGLISGGIGAGGLLDFLSGGAGGVARRSADDLYDVRDKVTAKTAELAEAKKSNEFDAVVPNQAQGILDDRYFNTSGETDARRANALGLHTPPQTTVKRREMRKMPAVRADELDPDREVIFSISDRAGAGGLITHYDGKELPFPVDAQGGQDAMIDSRIDPELYQRILAEHSGQKGNPLWMSDEGPLTGIMNAAMESRERTGKDPYFAPWRMVPTGIDHSTHTGDLMMSNAIGKLEPNELRELDEEIRNLSGQVNVKIDKKNVLGPDGKPLKETEFQGIKDWAGLAENPEKAIEQWGNATGAQRKAIKAKILHRYRALTGMSQGDARIAMTDENQVWAPDFALQNIGLIDTASGIGPRSSRTYGGTLHGDPIGELVGGDKLTIFDFFPELVEQKGFNKNTARRSAETRALTGKFSEGILDLLQQEMRK